MPIRLLLGDSSAGKTEAAQRRLLALKAADPLAKVWVLLATERQIQPFRARLIEHNAGRALFNVEFLSVYGLYASLLAAAGRPRRALSDSARQMLLRGMLRQRPAGTPFAAIAEAPGLARLLAQIITELKENLIQPEALAAAAGDSPRLREIAALYADYQQRLQHTGLSDREGESWLAIDALDQQPALASDTALLIVDGFDQFQWAQAVLLMRLAVRSREAIFTLTDPGERPALGKRFAQARARLEQAASALGASMETVALPPRPQQRPAALEALAQHLFTRSTAVPCDPAAFAAIEAPEAPAEAAAVVRHARRLIQQGAAPDDILIAVRDWAEYAPHLRAAAQRYGLPAHFHRAESGLETPAVAAVLRALALWAGGFRRIELIETLRSPYIRPPGWTAQHTDLLEREHMLQTVTGGRERWLEALASAAAQPAPSDLPDDEPTDLTAPERLLALRDALAQFFEQVTPPDNAPLNAYAAWLQRLLGDDPEHRAGLDDDELDEPQPYSLHVLEAIRDGDDPALIARDLRALGAWMQGVSGLLVADALAAELGVALPATGARFLADLIALAGAEPLGGVDRDGRVLITTVNDARGLPHRHVLIVGLSEGQFPAPAPEDPLLLDHEREMLRAAGLRLQTQAERSDDYGLFYELVCQASESLTLSRPTVRAGAPWIEGPLWRAATAVFNSLAPTRLRPGEVVPLDQCGTVGEAALAIVAADGPAGAAAWLHSTQPDRVARIRDGWQSETSRAAREPSASNGLLEAELTRAAAAARLSDTHLWSGSQLNELGACRFRFFARRLLKLEPIAEPEDGLDDATRGTITHALLHEVYSAVREHGWPLAPESTEDALEVLRAAAARLLPAAPSRYRFTPRAGWREECDALLRSLEALIRADFAGELFSRAQMDPRRVHTLEHGFGWDAPFSLALGDFSIRACGYIDRIDISADGARALVIDYKSGSTSVLPTPAQARQGRAFQMAVYLLAAQHALPGAQVGGAFVSIRDGKAGTVTWLSDGPEDAFPIEEARAFMRDGIVLARAGDFSAESGRNGACSPHCDYAHLCRERVKERLFAGDAHE